MGHKKMSIEKLLNSISNGTIKPGLIRHPELPPALMKEHSVGKAFYGTGTMEEWEIGFMRDCNPEKEVFVWQRIERATERYMAEHPEADLGETVAGICLCSMGARVPDYQQYWDMQ